MMINSFQAPTTYQPNECCSVSLHITQQVQNLLPIGLLGQSANASYRCSCKC